MPATPFNPALQVGTAIYNEKEYIGIESLDNARRNGVPGMQEFLNSAVVYAYGSNNMFSQHNYPILYQTQGMNKKRAVKSMDGLVRGFLLGKPKQSSVLAVTSFAPNQEVGRNNQEFKLVFRDRYFMKNQVLFAGGLSDSMVQLHTQGLPVRHPKGWEYTCRIFGGNRSETVPYEYLTAGTVWGGGVVAVSLEHSRGTESRSYFPFQTKNYLKTIRQSINVAGNAVNKVLNFTFNIDGKAFTFYYDWEKYLTEQQWNVKRDIDLLASKMTMDTDGIIINVDSDSGKPIYSGLGAWWQIPQSNGFTYGEMSENLIENWVTDILSMTDQLDRDPDQEVVIDVLCGYGFNMLMDKALKRNLTLLTPMVDSNLFVQKNAEGGLTSGAYFTRFKHRSGVILRFTSYSGFNKGPLAESSPRHPLYPNLPLSSFNAMVMDFSTVGLGNGKTGGNIEYLYEEGREYIEGTVRGLAKIDGKQGGDMATDIDASGMHMMATQGLHMNYPMSACKIECKLS